MKRVLASLAALLAVVGSIHAGQEPVIDAVETSRSGDAVLVRGHARPGSPYGILVSPDPSAQTDSGFSARLPGAEAPFLVAAGAVPSTGDVEVTIPLSRRTTELSVLVQLVTLIDGDAEASPAIAFQLSAASSSTAPAGTALDIGPSPLITARFFGSPTTGAAPLSVHFTDNSRGAITSWSWDFGDCGTSNLQNPGHQYDAPGVYTVSLHVSGPNGEDTETKVGYVVVTGTLSLKTERVASGLTRPVFVTHAAGDYDRLFIVEKAGVIKILDLGTNTVLGTPFLNINPSVGGGTSQNDERGLLGLAFHPDYQNTGLFYVNYTNNSSDTVIAEYAVSANPDIADAGSQRILMTINQPQSNHNGGWIGFGPLDDYLYIATGDGGNSCDAGSGHTAGTGNAQDITANLLGKILRIDVSGLPYTNPPSNPFVGITGDDEIWAYGLRNPWRSSFDRETGDLYIGDVGQGAREEISFLPATSPGGENFGWRCMEGTACSTASGCAVPTGCGCPGGTPGLTDPVYEYSHSPAPPPTSFVCSVTGGYVYRGCAMPTLQGTYFYADYCGNAIWSFVMQGGVATGHTDRTSELAPGGGLSLASIASFGEDAWGEMYIVEQTTSGEIYKILPD